MDIIQLLHSIFILPPRMDSRDTVVVCKTDEEITHRTSFGYRRASTSHLGLTPQIQVRKSNAGTPFKFLAASV